MFNSKTLRAALIALLIAPAMMQASEKKAPTKTWPETISSSFNSIWRRYGNYLGPVIGAATVGGLAIANAKNLLKTTDAKVVTISGAAFGGLLGLGGVLGYGVSSRGQGRIRFKEKIDEDTFNKDHSYWSYKNGYGFKPARFLPAMTGAVLGGLAALYVKPSTAHMPLGLGLIGGYAAGLAADRFNVVQGFAAGAATGATVGYAYGKSIKTAAVGAVTGAVLGAAGQRPANAVWTNTKAYFANCKKRKEEAAAKAAADASNDTTTDADDVSLSS